MIIRKNTPYINQTVKVRSGKSLPRLRRGSLPVHEVNCPPKVGHKSNFMSKKYTL